ncbi:metallophosphoesterase [Gilvimarinus sp. SDUM040014]|uniref:Metallophosphoesterase n=2 Tax=Gilvimarinus algae TaxID=3058037 RepID=A0ABT8TEI0_9GAMM|nr:metallophosphoesterase [Gilvimarinus sp. SDUM040014]
MASDKDTQALQIAFMPDIHFHDVYADFSGEAFTGIDNHVSGHKATIRSMRAQVHSTRLFNENYFALLAALDDAVERGIKLIALPGDFSDDGQPVHMRRFAEILKSYETQHGVRFFAAPGNHDPVRPYASAGGEPDFLNSDGSELAIYSTDHPRCQSATASDTPSGALICTEDIQHLGYTGILSYLNSAGFFPSSDYLYWETPFSSYSHTHYSLDKARAAGNMVRRQYSQCPAGKDTTSEQCQKLPDASYLVEPVKGLWLMSVDSNVYQHEHSEPSGYKGSGNAGYNSVLVHKSHLVDWLTRTSKAAEQQGKLLITFSHFPMVGFYDGKEDAIGELFGDAAFQRQRLPMPGTSHTLATTGVKVHIAGHMHLNDTGIQKTDQGHTLVNIQAPSLAAYPPAYKIIRWHRQSRLEVETVRIDQVPRFDELFEHYRTEHKYLTQTGADAVWDLGILDSRTYHDYTLGHLRELIKHRFIPHEWPASLAEPLLSLNALQLFTLAQMDVGKPIPTTPSDWLAHPDWQAASATAKQLINRQGIQSKALENLTGFEMIVDFYKVRNGGQLGLQDLPRERLAIYKLLTDSYSSQTSAPANRQGANVADAIGRFLAIFDAMMTGAADDHFEVDLDSGRVERLPRKTRQ